MFPDVSLAILPPLWLCRCSLEAGCTCSWAVSSRRASVWYPAVSLVSGGDQGTIRIARSISVSSFQFRCYCSQATGDVYFRRRSPFRECDLRDLKPLVKQTPFMRYVAGTKLFIQALRETDQRDCESIRFSSYICVVLLHRSGVARSCTFGSDCSEAI